MKTLSTRWMLRAASMAACLVSVAALAHSPKARTRVRSSLLPPGLEAPAPDGKIHSEVRPADAHHAASSRLRIDVRGLDAFAAITFWGDDPATAGDTTLAEFANLTTDRGGRARLDLDTRKGAALPFGASLEDLGGSAVEVRDAAGAVLVGVFPVAEGRPPRPTPPAIGRGGLEPPDGATLPDAKAEVEARVQPAHYDHEETSRLRIHVDYLAQATEHTLWGADPAGGGELTQFGTLTTNLGGHAIFLLDTRKGDALPFGATLDDLGGQALEVRDAAGAVALAGVFPEPVSSEPRAPRLRGSGDLAPPGSDPPPEDEGTIEFHARPARGHHGASSMVRIRLRGLEGGAAYTLWSDDPTTPSDPTLAQFASVIARRNGRADLRFDTAKLASLPFGATLTELGGASVEVRDAGGTVVLGGNFPTLP